jgi:excisionase family DNA binding protein
MSINDAAKASGMSAHYIRDLAKANEISYHKSGMKYLINYPKMMEYFEAHENTAA